MTDDPKWLATALRRQRRPEAEPEKPPPSFDGGAKPPVPPPPPSFGATIRAHLNARRRVLAEDYDPGDAA